MSTQMCKPENACYIFANSRRSFLEQFKFSNIFHDAM